jgi:fatty-acid peroxygenase
MRRDGIPRLSAPDSTLALLREGYRHLDRCDRLGTDAFRTRLMLAPVVCMRGAEAAALLYGSGRFGRERPIRRTTLRLLQGRGSLQQLSGAPHHHRKAMFMAMMTPEAHARARSLAGEARAALPR